MTEIRTDILIIGGGIAGCIAALAFCDSFQVTILDKLSEPREKIGESLAPAAQRILGVLGISEHLEKLQGSTFIPNMGMQSYWGSDRVQIADHLRNPDGFVKSLDRRAFEAFLRKHVEHRGVHCIWNAKYQSHSKLSKWKIVSKSNDRNGEENHISASFIIDATGRQSHFARSLSIKRNVVDKLIACWITLPNSVQQKLSLISAGKEGWWYSAVIPNGKRVIVYHTDSDLIAKSTLKSVDSFLRLAQQNEEIFNLIKGNEKDICFQGTVAANSSRLMKVAGDNWAAIGDAALSFDPLSSQGMFNAMASAMQLKDLFNTNGPIKQLDSVYTSQIDRIWQHYLGHRQSFYRAERRWPKSEFWRRRHL